MKQQSVKARRERLAQGCCPTHGLPMPRLTYGKKVASGEVIVVRYADDLVVGFQYRMDAERFPQEFRERLAKFGLELHADKTPLIEFGRFAARDRKYRGGGKPENFKFLGFTHFCGQL